MEKKKRKYVYNKEKQMEANKRYLENHPEAKEKTKKYKAKSGAKKYINEFATKDELEELLKNIQEILKKTVKNA